MRTALWGSVGVLAAIAAGVSAANAADIAAPVYKAPAYKAPPIIVSDWAGFYAGMAGGYGFGATSYPANPQGDNTKPKGALFGAYTGYNWQFGSWVAGVEVDFSAADIKDVDANGTTQRIDELASARARLGYTLMPNLLVYGTGGGGYGHLRLETTGVFAGPFGNAHQDNTGWVAGGGLEYKLTSNLTARAEYLHYDLGLATFTFRNGISGQGSFKADIVRGGLSYKF
jgi:outer membrane immunogenic protein